MKHIIATIQDEIDMLVEYIDIHTDLTPSDDRVMSVLRNASSSLNESNIKNVLYESRLRIWGINSEFSNRICHSLSEVESIVRQYTPYHDELKFCSAIRKIIADDTTSRSDDVSSYQATPLGGSGGGDTYIDNTPNSSEMSIGEEPPVINKTSVQPNVDLKTKLQESHEMLNTLISNINQCYGLALKNNAWDNPEESRNLSVSVTGALRRLKSIESLIRTMMFKADRK